MSNIRVIKKDSRDAVLTTLLADIMAGLSNAVEIRDQASMLLSGGTSPGALYHMMAQQEFDWDKVWFGLSDERWVAPDHADSNEKLVHDTLLRHQAEAAHFIGLKSAALDVGDGAPVSNELVAGLPSPYDIVLLGMGVDGHMASLFPDSVDTPAALSDDCAMLCHPIRRGEGETPRISMTRNALLNSREIKLLIFGDEKWAVFEQARGQISNHQPVSHILNQTQTPVTLYWAP
tara:strand:+ start:601 stop:1299 length:699 start_codon:yes stop_codon:yes gene_type:complete